MSIHAQKYALLAESVSKTQKVIPTMLAVCTLKSDVQVDHLSPTDSLADSVQCISSITGDCFEIRLIRRLAREQLIRLAYFAQSLEMKCSWKTAAFAKEKTSPPCSFLIDHHRRMLYVGVEVLYQSHEVVLNLAKHIIEYLSIASDGQNTPSEGSFHLVNGDRLLISQTASVTLILDLEKGLRFPSKAALSAKERTIHIATVGDEIYIRSAVWRLFHQTYEPLPCYSYSVEIDQDAESYFIPLPLNVLYVLKCVPKMTFSVCAI